MKKTFNSRIAVKILSVFICVVMLLGIAPVGDILNIVQNTYAASASANYNPEYGKYSASGNKLTATPYENCGFRGWYYNGKEVSTDLEYTFSSGTASDYTPVFYSYNLLENGDFETYNANTSLLTDAFGEEEKWYFYERDGGTWPSFKVSSDYNHDVNGSKSLKTSVIYNTGYRYLKNLQKNTQYTLKFWYYCPDSLVFLNFASVSAGIVEISDTQARKGYETLGCYYNAEKSVYTDWKEVSITFYTGENTEATFAISYQPISSDYSNAYMYIDSLALIKDEMNSPSTYANDDFAVNSAENWTALNSVNKSVTSEELKVVATAKYSGVQSKVMRLKKGYSYQMSVNVNLSNTDTSNRINWSLSKAESKSGTDSATTLITDTSKYNVSTGFTVKRSTSSSGTYSDKTFGTTDSSTLNKRVINNSVSNYPIWDFPLENCKNGTYNGTRRYYYNLTNCTVTVSFTAPETTDAYFNFWVNDIDGSSNYLTLDNFKVTETAPSDITESVKDIVASNAVNCVGTAIRTSGTQGLRYKTGIDKRLLTSDKYFGIRVVEYGTVAIRTGFLNGEELELNTTYTAADGTTMTSRSGTAYRFVSGNPSSGSDIRYDENDYEVHYTGVLINIAAKHENSGYTMRPYVKYIDATGNAKYIYGDALDTTVFEVSKLAYSAKKSDGTFAENESVREYLYDRILSKYSDKTVTVKNTSTPISKTFQGINSTVYHCYTFMDDSAGRNTYTDEQAAIEMNRLVDSGVTNVRTAFRSQFAWTDSGWNWNSNDMKAVYKWAKMLQNRGITITINAGWHIYDFICYYNYNVLGQTDLSYNESSSNRGHSTIPEVDYLHGSGTALYGEDSKADALKTAMSGLNLTESELSHYSVAAVRYGEWIVQAMEAFENNGVYNVEYIMPFTESGDYRSDDSTFSYDEWIIMAAGLNDALEEAGIRNNVKLIGPSQSLYTRHNREKTLLAYYLEFATSNPDYDMMDILSSHQYATTINSDGSKGSIYNSTGLYNNVLTNFDYYNKQIDTAHADTEFWCDEYFAQGCDANWVDGVGMQLTQVAAGFTAAANMGIDRLISWQIFDQLWPDNTGSNAEFISGVHAVGTCPSMISGNLREYKKYASDVPRVTYYGLNLLGKYLSNTAGTVYSTTVSNGEDTSEGGVYVTAIKGDDGKTVILAVNTTSYGKNITYNFEKSVDNNFVRYTYNPEGITPTSAAISIASDGTVVSVGSDGNFYDTIAPYSFSIYVSETSTNEPDVNIDSDLLD